MHFQTSVFSCVTDDCAPVDAGEICSGLAAAQIRFAQSRMGSKYSMAFVSGTGDAYGRGPVAENVSHLPDVQVEQEMYYTCILFLLTRSMTGW